MENNFKKDNLFIAELRWLDEGKGIEYDKPLSYVILNKNNNQYYNVFDIYESYPVFARSRTYSNCTRDGVEYGTKMIYKGGELEDGPCWVIDSTFPLEKEELSIDELKDFILKDERFFKDRRLFAVSNIKNPLELLKVLSRDVKAFKYMNYYIESRKVQKVKKI